MPALQAILALLTAATVVGKNVKIFGAPDRSSNVRVVVAYQLQYCPELLPILQHLQHLHGRMKVISGQLLV